MEIKLDFKSIKEVGFPIEDSWNYLILEDEFIYTAFYTDGIFHDGEGYTYHATHWTKQPKSIQR